MTLHLHQRRSCTTTKSNNFTISVSGIRTYESPFPLQLQLQIRNPWNNTYEMGPASYWHSSPGGAGGGGVLNKFLYTIFHNFVYLLLTKGTPFTYLAYNFGSVLTAGDPHCHKIGISHKYRTLSRRVRGWTSGRSLPVQIFVEYFSGISGGASPYRPSYWEYPSPGLRRK